MLGCIGLSRVALYVQREVWRQWHVGLPGPMREGCSRPTRYQLDGWYHSQHNSATQLPTLQDLRPMSGLDETTAVLPRVSQHMRRVDESKSYLSSRSYDQEHYMVVHFDEQGVAKDRQVTAADIQVDRRDISIFSKFGGAKQRAGIYIKGHAMLFSSEITQALVTSDQAFVFHSRRFQDTARIVYGGVDPERKQPVPFELRVLEALLDETASFFERKARRVALLLTSLLQELAEKLRNGVQGELQRLLPMQRALTEIQHDVKEAREALSTILEHQQNVTQLILPRAPASPVAQGPNPAADVSRPPGNTSAGPPHTSQLASKAGTQQAPGSGSGLGAQQGGEGRVEGHEAEEGLGQQVQWEAPGVKGAVVALAGEMVESYERRLRSVEGTLRELEENMDSSREMWHMLMDSTRNRIIRINLYLSMASFAFIAAQLPAAFFGMNLPTGLEAHPTMFRIVTAACVAGSAMLYMALYSSYRFWPLMRHKQRMDDMAALRLLMMNHIDDLDAIVKELANINTDKINKQQFARSVQQVMKSASVSPTEVDLIYRIFDTNKTGLLETTELVKLARDKLGVSNADELFQHTITETVDSRPTREGLVVPLLGEVLRKGSGPRPAV